VGIESRYLEAAAAEGERGAPTQKRFHVLGAPAAIERERVLPGMITPEKWERIVPELRRALGKIGSVEQLGRSYAWSSPQEFDYLALTPEGDGTRLTIRSDPFLWFLIYVPGVILHIISLAVAVSLPFTLSVELPLAGGIMGGVFTLQRLLMRRLMRGHEKTIDGLSGRIASILREE
jgi:hypothetical protein